jgi:eukaryotic-like serine/threonine-protein kinase
LFLSALEYPPAYRAAFLDAACADDPVVRARVESLLSAEEPARDFLAQPAAGLALAVERSVPDRLGPYKLLQKIGAGGMGTVWMAEQTEPVRRTVALKVISGGTDSAHVAARFEAERQALALMDHPNIAKVLDAGATPDGRPYFVMELVKGVPITAFCDDPCSGDRRR